MDPNNDFDKHDRAPNAEAREAAPSPPIDG